MDSEFWLRESNKTENIEDLYEIGKEIGRSPTSSVCHSKLRGSIYEYAVKIVRKPFKIGNVTSEVGILLKLDHPNIIRLKEIFETKSHIYMVLEYVSGGELLDRIVARGFYSELDAAFCIKQILEGVKYLHKFDIVHRDLKPENLLYADQSENAHLKIADFSLSRVLTDTLQSQAVHGSPEYCAPEMLSGVKYGTQVDLWSVGVILYILLCGYEPFYHEDNSEMFRKIRRGHFAFPSPHWDNISLNAKDLVLKLLQVDQSKRLTAGKALAHPWVQGLANRREHMEETKQNIKEYAYRRKMKAATHTIMVAQKLTMLIHPTENPQDEVVEHNIAEIVSPMELLDTTA